MSDWVELIKGFAQSFMQTTKHTAERHVLVYFYNMKRALFRFAIEIILLLAGIVLALAGLVVFLSRFIPIEFIMLISGLILINVVLLTAKFKA
jgi:hypothetical protein